MAKEKPAADAAHGTPAVPEVPKAHTGHAALFATKADFQAFLEAIKTQDPLRYERQKHELEAALASF